MLLVGRKVDMWVRPGKSKQNRTWETVTVEVSSGQIKLGRAVRGLWW